jgi:hypothetical protein
MGTLSTYLCVLHRLEQHDGSSDDGQRSESLETAGKKASHDEVARRAKIGHSDEGQHEGAYRKRDAGRQDEPLYDCYDDEKEERQ